VLLPNDLDSVSRVMPDECATSLRDFNHFKTLGLQPLWHFSAPRLRYCGALGTWCVSHFKTPKVKLLD
jgi:hypothetical protein